MEFRESNAAIYELKKVSTTLKVTYKKQLVLPYDISDISDYVTVTENGNDITSKTSNWKLSSITGPGGVSLSTSTLSTQYLYFKI